MFQSWITKQGKGREAGFADLMCETARGRGAPELRFGCREFQAEENLEHLHRYASTQNSGPVTPGSAPKGRVCVDNIYRVRQALTKELGVSRSAA